jgi:hypothetical protein
MELLSIGANRSRLSPETLTKLRTTAAFPGYRDASPFVKTSGASGSTDCHDTTPMDDHVLLQANQV